MITYFVPWYRQVILHLTELTYTLRIFVHPYAMAYCYVTPDKATLFIDTARVSAEAAAELKENGVELAEYDDVLTLSLIHILRSTMWSRPSSTTSR